MTKLGSKLRKCYVTFSQMLKSNCTEPGLNHQPFVPGGDNFKLVNLILCVLK